MKVPAVIWPIIAVSGLFIGVLSEASPSAAQEQVRLYLPIAHGGGGVAECPIDADARRLIEELVFEASREAVWAAGSTGYRERGFAISMPGIDEAYMGAATLIEECSRAMSYDHYCDGDGEPGFWSSRSRCLRMGCQADRIGYADLYVAELPHEEPLDRHPIDYASELPAGSIRFEENPLRRWVYDLRDADASVVTGTLEARYRFTAEAGASLDMRHSGQVWVRNEGHDPAELGLELRYPDLAERPIEVALHMDAGHLDAGSVRYGERPIAAIEGIFAPDTPPTFRWFAACGNPTGGSGEP